MRQPQFIALLGRSDTPTDGVADYCRYLAEAFQRRNIPLRTVRVPWAERGWPKALRWLGRESAAWENVWVLLQYTALSWSRRGFPFGALRVLSSLQKHGIRCVVVFHDGAAFSGPRIRDRMRRAAQKWTLQRLNRRAAHSVFTIPLDSVDWLSPGERRAAFIPIGANIPECRTLRTLASGGRPKTIAVFSITVGAPQAQEVEDIASVVRRATENVGPVCLEVFGRGAMDARGMLENALRGVDVELRVRGVIPAVEITRTFLSSDVSLCVRGLTASNRGTSIAGIACGVPVVGYGRPGTDPAIDAAGVLLVPWRDPNALGEALLEVLTKADRWQQLHERNLQAQERYFSWDAVANRYLELHVTNGGPA